MDDSNQNVVDGVIVTPIENKWKMENDVLIMGIERFKIIKLNKKYLIIERKKIRLTITVPQAPANDHTSKQQ